jgi:hypothetical protein
MHVWSSLGSFRGSSRRPRPRQVWGLGASDQDPEGAAVGQDRSNVILVIGAYSGASDKIIGGGALRSLVSAPTFFMAGSTFWPSSHTSRASITEATRCEAHCRYAGANSAVNLRTRRRCGRVQRPIFARRIVEFRKRHGDSPRYDRQGVEVRSRIQCVVLGASPPSVKANLQLTSQKLLSP